jgi:hypothetical protein
MEKLMKIITSISALWRRYMNRSKMAVTWCLLWVLSACASNSATTSEAIFYPPLPQIPRVQFLTSISSEDDLSGTSSSLKTFLVGDEEDFSQRIARPWGISHGEGKIYVADKSFNIVLIVDLESESFDSIQDARGGILSDVNGVFVDTDNYKYVPDLGGGRVAVYDDRNEYVKSYGEKGQFGAAAVAAYKDKVYIADIRESDIKVLDNATGEVMDIIGGIGQDEGMFNKPTHLDVDTLGNLYVTDAFNFRFQKFDSDGNFVKSLGFEGGGPGGAVRPKGLSVDRAGHLYTVDAAMEIVQIFDVESGEPLLAFGKGGRGGTQMPSTVHIDYDNVRYFEEYAEPGFNLKYLIYVGNSLGNNKLNVYGFGDWTGGSLEGETQPGQPEPGPKTQGLIPGPDDLIKDSGSTK